MAGVRPCFPPLRSSPGLLHWMSLVPGARLVFEVQINGVEAVDVQMSP